MAVKGAYPASMLKLPTCHFTFQNGKTLAVPRIKSAIKRVEVAERNRERNRAWKSSIRTARTQVEEAVKKEGNQQEALNNAYSVIDTAVSKGILHRNTGARRKARLVAMMKKSAGA